MASYSARYLTTVLSIVREQRITYVGIFFLQSTEDIYRCQNAFNLSECYVMIAL